MAVLSKQDILNASDLKRELVRVPEWGGEVYVTALSGFAKDAYEQSCYKVGVDGKVTSDTSNLRAKFVAATLCDEEGNLLFSVSDVEALGKKSGAALDRVYDAAKALNAMSNEDIEDLAKN